MAAESEMRRSDPRRFKDAMVRQTHWAPPSRLSCLTCNHLGQSEWCVLAKDQLEEIDRVKTVRTYKEGEAIYTQGEACLGIHCVESGTVAMRLTDVQGNSKILRLAQAGQTVGYADFFAGKGYRSTAYCLRPTTVCHIPSQDLRDMLNRCPTLGLAFLAHGAEDLLHSDTTSMQQVTSTVRMRVSQLLLSLKDSHGISESDGAIALNLPMTWQEAAELIGARPETVSRAVQGLIADHVIQVAGHTVKIGDLDNLLDELEPQTA